MVKESELIICESVSSKSFVPLVAVVAKVGVSAELVEVFVFMSGKKD